MEPAKNPRQFRINPVEMTIFSGVAALFLSSLYHLFYDHQAFQTAALSPASPAAPAEGRSPASASQAFQSLEIQCTETLTETQTTASKVRISGPLCGAPNEPGRSVASAAEPRVENQTNRVTATVFIDRTAERFSTDYLPLNPGKNLVSIGFSSESQKKTVVLEVNRN